jgi:hypothetical protein
MLVNLCTNTGTKLIKKMTLREINSKRRHGDISTVSELSGIPERTIKAILSGYRKETTKRGKEVIAWFTNFLECREMVKGDDNLTND